MAEAKAKCLKEALEDAEVLQEKAKVELASERKKHRVAQEVTKVEKKKGQLIEVEVSDEEARKERKRAFKAEQRALESEKACADAFAEVKHLREVLRRVERKSASKRAQSAEACASVAKAVEEEMWGAVETVARLRNELKEDSDK
ncbi:hypothetical protein COCNU_scaffold000976G000010 [Cocos nucifera]|nr:hypothetical protein [Cocos nucifera]